MKSFSQFVGGTKIETPKIELLPTKDIQYVKEQLKTLQSHYFEKDPDILNEQMLVLTYLVNEKTNVYKILNELKKELYINGRYLSRCIFTKDNDVIKFPFNNIEEVIEKVNNQLNKYDDFSMEVYSLPNFSIESNYKGNDLYHVTSKDRVESILNNGLICKNEKKSHNNFPRIYLTSGIEESKKFENKLHELFNTNTVRLYINNENLKLKLYKDPEWYCGLFTYQNIPAKYINIRD